MRKARIIATLAIGVATLFLLERVVAAPFRANIAKKEVTAATAIALALGDEARARDAARTNLATLARLELVLPRDAVVQVLVAANHRALRQYPEAIDAYDKALRWEPTAYVWLNRGVTELAAHRPDAARASFARAIAFDPSLRAETDEALRAWEASTRAAKQLDDRARDAATDRR